MEASYVDLADPTHLEFDYLRWIQIVLDVVAARQVLHIGGGACALARALAALVTATAVLREFFTMNASVSFRASSSGRWLCGDFIR